MRFSIKWTRVVLYLIIFSVLFSLARRNYVLYHTIIEFFAIFTGLSITLVSFATREFSENKIFTKFGLLYLFVSSLDFLHTLAYKGMGVFRGWTANQPTQFWIAGRLLETIGFFLVAFFQKLSEGTIFSVFGLLSVLFVVTVLLGFFPDCFVEGFGLTPFKVTMEYLMMITLLITLIKILKSKEWSISIFRKSIVLAIVFTALGELSFTLYTDVYGFFNFLGHVFRFISYLVILSGIVVNSLKNPIRALIAELDKERERLKRMAHHDSLTGLYSRNFFNEWVRKQISIASRQNVPISFIIMDVDNFKQINDTFGHVFGDEVLKFVANCISNSIRSSDMAARYGGDEFVVVLNDANEQQALQIAERIKERLKNSSNLNYDVSISYGVAQLDPFQDYTKVLQKADQAMYEMKKSKKIAS